MRSDTVAQEIERRFLVKAYTPNAFDGWQKTALRQAYVGDGLRVREHRQLGEAISSFWITHKAGKGRVREEREALIDAPTARILFDSTPYVIEKTRLTDGTWEVDFFHGPLEGLVLAEIELDHPFQGFEMPAWMLDSVEVTETLTNSQLAKTALHLKHDSAGQPAADALQSRLLKRVPRIAITGAPCSGKSTAIANLRAARSDVLCVPEVATIVMGQCELSPTVLGVSEFQRVIRDVQLTFESGSLAQAAKLNKQAVIFDRGTLDSAAFIGGLDVYERVLNANRAIEYRNYDAVLLLRLPSRECFDDHRTNNPIRRETYEQAVAIEDALISIWGEHPAFRYVHDRPTWDEKYDALVRLIDGVINDFGR